MIQSIKELSQPSNLSVSGKTLELQHEKKCIEFQGRTYTTLTKVLQKIPELKHPKKAKELAQVANCLLSGKDCMLVEDPTAYKNKYFKRLEQLANGKHVYPCIIDYGFFDTSKLALPKNEGASIKYCVEESRTGLPYTVTCELDKNLHHMKLLPYA